MACPGVTVCFVAVSMAGTTSMVPLESMTNAALLFGSTSTTITTLPPESTLAI